MKWLHTYSWLSYSESLNGGLCIPCVFHLKMNHNQVGKFVTSPMIKFKDAIADLRKHESTIYHKNSLEDNSRFIAVMENKKQSAIMQVNNYISKQIECNRAKLKSILDIIILCGRQNISLRGHNEYSTDPNSNLGNFNALLNLCMNSGNDILKEHLLMCNKNAKYTSKTTQNELIFECGEYIKERIIDDIKKAKYFSVLADETTDVSNTEQMALAIRYFNGKCITEKFISFIECENLSGESIANLIMDTLTKAELNLENLRGQGYDGAGNMSGKVKGASSIILNKYPKATYVHCRSHVLNLSIVNACKMPLIQNMMGILLEICIFFKYSAKRQGLLEENITTICVESSKKKLINLCKTRWIARHDALRVFIELYQAILETMLDIYEDKSWNSESVTKANGLYNSMINSQFIMSLIVCNNSLNFKENLTTTLQSRSIDAYKANKDIQSVIKGIQVCRDNIDEVQLEWDEEASH